MRTDNVKRQGFTLVEQLAVLVLTAVVLAAGIPHVIAQRDAAAVRQAIVSVRGAFGTARDHAIASGARTAVRFARESGASGAFSGTVVVHASSDTMHRLPLGALLGVTLVASRDSMTYLPSGLGVGAANLSVTIARGRFADTLTVSRLGRVR